MYTRFRALWKDKPDETTPLTAAALNHIEGGIEDAANVVVGADSPLSSLPTGRKVIWFQDLGSGNWTINIVTGD